MRLLNQIQLGGPPILNSPVRMFWFNHGKYDILGIIMQNMIMLKSLVQDYY